MGLRQIDVAKIIGCDEMTVVKWEKSHPARPQVNPMAGVVRFLGFNPLPRGHTTAEGLVNLRTAQGKTQRAFAIELGGDRKPAGKYAKAVEAALTQPIN